MDALCRLPPTHLVIRDEARAVASRIAPFAAAADERDEVDPRLDDALRESGLYALSVPGPYGGRFPDVDPVAICVVREVLMGTSCAADSLFALQGIGSYGIAAAGSDEQREKWLPAVGKGTARGALALTEPDTGSDLKAITTSVTRAGSRLLLTGHKAFISNATIANYFLVLAREPDTGLSTFVVDATAPGVSTRSGPGLAAPHAIGDVQFEQVELGEEARLGEPGRGLEPVLATLGVFRVSVAAAAVGLAETALRAAADHARERTAFGRPLARLGPVAGLLADAWTELEAARLLTYRAAELSAVDSAANLEYASMAKLYATEACGRIVDRCVQVSGRFGLVRGSRLDRCTRQARPMRIYEGASEVIRLGIARELMHITGTAAS